MKEFETITVSNDNLVVSHENGNVHIVSFASVPESIKTALDVLIQYANARTTWINED